MESLHNASDNDVFTFGELCEAISEREVPVTVEDGFYVVRRRDLKRFIEPADDNCPSLLLGILPVHSALVAG
jgi:hypothetical protein